MKNRISEKYEKFVDLLDFGNGKYSRVDVFRDFVSMFAIAIKNSFYYEQVDEDIYMQIIKKYERKETEIFPKMTVELINIYTNEREIKDILGEIFEQIGAASKSNDQYFTPNHIARLISKINFNKSDLEKEKIITINDACCGSGVLLLSYANELEENHIDYSKRAFFVGQDIDFICCCMAYIQASIYEMSAAIIWGNSLSDEKRKVFYTPKYFTENWYEKLNKDKK